MINQDKSSHFNVLLAFDGSEHSHAAISFLCELCTTSAISSRASMHILAVFSPLQAGDQEPLRDALQWAHSYLESKCFLVTSELVLGNPAEKIIEYSEKIEPDLIVLGAKGLRATLGILLGGVAQQVVEYACCPVLVVRAPYAGVRHILLVTDGSPHSDRATQYLAHFPIPANAEMHVMHVLPPLPLTPSPEYFARTYPLAPEIMAVYPPPMSENGNTWKEEEEANGKAILEKTLSQLEQNGITAVPILLRGDTATEIINYVKENKVDLIVSGSRGLSQVKSWLLGSVSRKLVHYSGCSILIAKGPLQA
jgi:nucleotide-binding universal stress UspA family protein